MVSAMKGTNLARDKYSFVNMKNISLKLKEAQEALTQANLTLDKTDETLEIIHNQQSAVDNETNLRYLLSSKYWARWDANAISNKYEQVRFWATAMANDKIRDSLMGETIDVANLGTAGNLYKGVMIPRGFYSLGTQTNVRSNDLYWPGINNIGNSLWDGGFTAQIASIVGYQPNTHAFYGLLNKKADTATHPTSAVNVTSLPATLYAAPALDPMINLYSSVPKTPGNFNAFSVISYDWNGSSGQPYISAVQVPYVITKGGSRLFPKYYMSLGNLGNMMFYTNPTDPSNHPLATAAARLGEHSNPYPVLKSAYNQQYISVISYDGYWSGGGFLTLEDGSRLECYGMHITLGSFTVGDPTPISNDFYTQSYYTYNENVFGIDSRLIGNRQIVQTNIIKTRVTFPQGLYLCNTVTVKCNDGGTYLLMERETVQYYSGSGADVSQIEQIIYNFDPKATSGNFFTTDFRGRIHEVWYTTRDGHTVSYRPNLTYRDNYLGDTFVNRTVTYDEFTNYS